MDDGTGADTADEGEEEAAPEGDEEMEERDLEMLERAEQRFARAPRLEQMARKPLKVGFFRAGLWGCGAERRLLRWGPGRRRCCVPGSKSQVKETATDHQTVPLSGAQEAMSFGALGLRIRRMRMRSPGGSHST